MEDSNGQEADHVQGVRPMNKCFPADSSSGSNMFFRSTNLKADWLYTTAPADWIVARSKIRQAMLETFAGHESL